MTLKFVTTLKQIFANNSGTSAVKKDCPYCGGGRCMGMCGGALAKLTKATFEGTIELISPETGVVIVKDGTNYTFKPTERFGKMLLKRCPDGSHCQVVALVDEQHIEKLISAKIIS